MFDYTRNQDPGIHGVSQEVLCYIPPSIEPVYNLQQISGNSVQFKGDENT